MDIPTLIAGCLAGSRAAQRELFHSYRLTVLHLVWRMLGPRDNYEVDEAIQEVFVQVFRSLRAYRGDSSFDTWIYRVAANVCASLLRKRYRWFERSRERESDIDRHPATTDGPHRRLERRDLARAIYGALDRIATERRVVFVLVDMEGKSLEEAAGIVGKPLGTVKSRLFRARNDLARLLKPLLGYDESGEAME
jgi:RNA polymerase sigma-70 factor, ECF subfamily